MIYKEIIRIGALLLLDKVFTGSTPSTATSSNVAAPLSDGFARGVMLNLLRLSTSGQFSFINGFATKQGGGLKPNELSDLIFQVDDDFSKSHPIGQFEPFVENWFQSAQNAFLKRVNPQWRDTIQGMINGPRQMRPTTFSLLKHHTDSLVMDNGFLSDWKSYQNSIKTDERLNFAHIKEAVVTNKLIEAESNRIAASSLDAVQYLPARLLHAAKLADRRHWPAEFDGKRIPVTSKSVYPLDIDTNMFNRETPILPISVIPIRRIDNERD